MALQQKEPFSPTRPVRIKKSYRPEIEQDGEKVFALSDLYHLAGELEVGGGVLLISTSERAIRPRITLTDEKLHYIASHKQLFDGRIHKQTEKESYTWTIESERAQLIMHLIAPFAPAVARFRERYMERYEAAANLAVPERRETRAQILSEYQEDLKRYVQEDPKHKKKAARFEGLTPEMYASIVRNPAFLAGVLDGRASTYINEGVQHVKVRTTNKALIDALIQEYGGIPYLDKSVDGTGWVIAGERMYRVLAIAGSHLHHEKLNALREKEKQATKTVLDIIALHPEGIRFTDIKALVKQASAEQGAAVEAILEVLEQQGKIHLSPRRSANIKIYTLAQTPENLSHIAVSPVLLAQFLRNVLHGNNAGIVLSQSGKIIATHLDRQSGTMQHWHEPVSKTLRGKIRSAITARKHYERISTDGQSGGIFHVLDQQGLTARKFNNHAITEVPDALHTLLGFAFTAYTLYNDKLQGNLPSLPDMETLLELIMQ